METIGSNPKWALYDELIEGIPSGIAVCDYALGVHWSCVDAECGMGLSYTLSGGAKRKNFVDFRKQDLRSMAALSKSWNNLEATLGIAALNAYYAQAEKYLAIGDLFGAEDDAPSDLTEEQREQCDHSRKRHRKADAFEIMRPEIEEMGGKANVVVIGHFPHVENIAEYADLTVLERNCKNDCDTPDPACEYVIPEADFVFMTGVTLINKTAPRLLELAKDAKVVMVGPSVIPAQTLFDHGVDMLASREVLDAGQCMFCIKTGTGFGKSIKMINLVPSL